jgi:hypothetical protein
MYCEFICEQPTLLCCLYSGRCLSLRNANTLKECFQAEAENEENGGLLGQEVESLAHVLRWST